jgi:peptidoglycan/LPS O-acetylase OafA/YrhL
VGLLGRGPIGVDLFFAISGFLITTLLVRERLLTGKIDLLAFYARRSLRIFPLYYLVLGLHVVFALFVRPKWGPSRNFLAVAGYYATYTANWVRSSELSGPALFMFGWSLCTEEQFYAFWAPVLTACRRLWCASTVIALWLLLDILLERRGVGGGSFDRSLLVTVVTSFASPIGFGALLALGMHHRFSDYWLWSLLGRRLASPIVGALVVSLIVFPWAPATLLHFALALLVVSCSLRPDHGLAWLLDNQPMRFVGRISYGIYLLHVPVIGAVRGVFPNLRPYPVWIFAFAVPLSVAVAAVSYRMFERPLLSLGARYRRV